MKDGEKGLLALAVVVGYFYTSKRSTAGNTPLSRGRRHGPYRDQEQSSSRLAVGAFPKGSKVLDMTKMEASPKPKKGGIHNAIKPVRPLEMMRNGDMGQAQSIFDRMERT